MKVGRFASIGLTFIRQSLWITSDSSHVNSPFDHFLLNTDMILFLFRFAGVSSAAGGGFFGIGGGGSAVSLWFWFTVYLLAPICWTLSRLPLRCDAAAVQSIGFAGFVDKDDMVS